MFNAQRRLIGPKSAPALNTPPFKKAPALNALPLQNAPALDALPLPVNGEGAGGWGSRLVQRRPEARSTHLGFQPVQLREARYEGPVPVEVVQPALQRLQRHRFRHRNSRHIAQAPQPLA